MFLDPLWIKCILELSIQSFSVISCSCQCPCYRILSEITSYELCIYNQFFCFWKKVDHSIVEAFAQGGRTCITSRVYPTKAIYKETKLYVFNNATTATVTASIKTWQMSSARMLRNSIWVHLIMFFSTFIFIGRPLI